MSSGVAFVVFVNERKGVAPKREYVSLVGRCRSWRDVRPDLEQVFRTAAVRPLATGEVECERQMIEIGPRVGDEPMNVHVLGIDSGKYRCSVIGLSASGRVTMRWRARRGSTEQA